MGNGVGRGLTRGQRAIVWIEKHCRIPEGKFVGKPVKLSAKQKHWIRRIYDTPTRTFILSMGRKNAKALALTTPIPTPSGWKTLGEIKAGDFVFAPNGQPVRVLVESEIFIGKKCFRLTFSDGSTIDASEDHVWTTTHKYRPWESPATYSSGKVRGNGERTGRWVKGNVTTSQIFESLTVPNGTGRYEANHKIEVAQATQSADTPVPIPPYVLGVWLGDGSSSNSSITCGEKDLPAMLFELERELGNAMTVARYSGNPPTVRPTGTGLQKALRVRGLLNNKHIPKEYFDSGTDQRWALLQGLMDTDGTVNRGNGKAPRCSFCSTLERLAVDVWRLARSLGLKATLRKRVAMLNGVVTGFAWYVSFPADSASPVFRLTRKQSLLPESLGKRSGTLTIVACEEIESVPTKCIAVDSEDHLFLAGYGCVPTHNTALAAFLLLVHLCGPEAKPNSQLYSAAQSREQAAILFALAAKIVRMSPELSSVVTIRDTAKQLLCQELGTLYRALSAEASTSYGLSPIFTVHDELGQVKGPRSELYDALETASAAQESPLSIIISTQAPTDNDLLSILIDDALTGADPLVKVELHTTPMDMDPFSEEAIRLANPHFDVFMNKEEVLRQAEKAKRMPTTESSYRNLILNQRVEARKPFVTLTVWKSNGAMPHGSIAGKRVWGGLDLSSVNDLTALVLTTEEGDVYPTFWLPEDGLAEKAKDDRVPYDLWYAQGHLEATPGKSIDYEYVAAYLRNVFDMCDIQALAFDRYNMKFLKPWLVKAGFTDKELELFVEFGQGFVSMSPAIRELESKLLNGKLRHGNHPVLTMCAFNATITQDAAENRKFVKSKAIGRIDGMVALAMSIGVMPLEIEKDKPKEFQMIFI